MHVRYPIGLQRYRAPGANAFAILFTIESLSRALLVSVMMALHASFMAYQSTTEVASTHTIARLVMHRMLTLIRLFFGSLISCVRSRAALEAEILALRHQLLVCQRLRYGRLPLTRWDRALWALVLRR